MVGAEDADATRSVRAMAKKFEYEHARHVECASVQASLSHTGGAIARLV
jgi:hypothetical protein